VVRAPRNAAKDMRMDDKALKAAVDAFLKKAAFAAQREIEGAVRKALADGTLKGSESFTAAVSLSSEKIELNVTIYGKIEL
jgi:hypothetical protein